MAGKRIIGETETYEHVANKRIVDKAKGDLESTFVWTFDGENGTTKVNFEADYTTPMPFLAPKDEKFFLHRNELEADTLLSNLKARLEV